MLIMGATSLALQWSGAARVVALVATVPGSLEQGEQTFEVSRKLERSWHVHVRRHEGVGQYSGRLSRVRRRR